jgi:hypothetical protein
MWQSETMSWMRWIESLADAHWNSRNHDVPSAAAKVTSHRPHLRSHCIGVRRL